MGATPDRRPVQEIIRRKVTEELGGAPDNHERILMALLMLVHGTAMLLIAKNIVPEEADEARSVFTASVKALMEKAHAV
jgi:hypothetical protein